MKSPKNEGERLPVEGTSDLSARVRHDIIVRLLGDAIHHKAVSGDCDCRPEDTVNWQHAMTCLDAAKEIHALRTRCEELAQQVVDAGLLHLADESDIYQLCARIKKLEHA